MSFTFHLIRTFSFLIASCTSSPRSAWADVIFPFLPSWASSKICQLSHTPVISCTCDLMYMQCQPTISPSFQHVLKLLENSGSFQWRRVRSLSGWMGRLLVRIPVRPRSLTLAIANWKVRSWPGETCGRAPPPAKVHQRSLCGPLVLTHATENTAPPLHESARTQNPGGTLGGWLVYP